MKNSSLKNILIVSFALIGIMIVSTLIVLGFNFLVGFSTDVHSDDVATSIAAVAFGIGIVLRLVYSKMENE